jgi:hypothetical protein
MYSPSLCKAFDWEIMERFIQFCPIISHASEALESVVLNIVNELELSISDFRGQSFDNVAYMTGKYSGLYIRIKSLNYLADLVPYCHHSLNPVGSCAAECCTQAVIHFGFL